MCVFFLTNLADELSELVQVALSIRSDAQLPDAAVELLRSLKRILQREHEAEQELEAESVRLILPGDIMITQHFKNRNI